jgi:DNA modification methylase
VALAGKVEVFHSGFLVLYCRKRISVGDVSKKTNSQKVLIDRGSFLDSLHPGAFSERTPFFSTSYGSAYHGNALDYLRQLPNESLNLIMTSPPFALQRKKQYGNVDANEYIEWFHDFAVEFYRVLKNDGSLVIDLGGSWVRGIPVRSLYHFELVIDLCKRLDPIGRNNFYLAEEFFWYNPAKLPTPAEWVTVRRVRVKDAVNTVWWLSKNPNPKASNRNVLKTYSQSMQHLLQRGYKPKLRPSGHDISGKFGKDNGGAIPPNLLQISNTDSNSRYQRLCRDNNLPVHPARFPSQLPAFFIKFLTDADDLVLDPFAGSGMTGAVAERLKRRWLAYELVEEYLKGARFRFSTEALEELPVHVGDIYGEERGNGSSPKTTSNNGTKHKRVASNSDVTPVQARLLETNGVYLPKSSQHKAISE